MILLVKMSNDTVKNAHIMLYCRITFISYVEQKKEKFKL